MRPYVIMQVGSSLDGKVAARGGQETTISCKESFRTLHGLRDGCDAVIVGRSTVETDDPRLTVREVPTTRQPLRVIFDSELKLKKSHKVFADDNYVVFCDEKLGKREERVVGIPRGAHGLLIDAALSALSDRGIAKVLVEGGPTLWTSFLNAGVTDEIWWFQSPLLLGTQGVAALGELEQGAHAFMNAESHESESFQNGRDTLTIMRADQAHRPPRFIDGVEISSIRRMSYFPY